MQIKTSVTGFPRIGENRELKKVLEKYWAGKASLTELKNVSKELRKKHWLLQKEAGIDLISVNDFSWYDSMLDTIVMLNAIPGRFQDINDETDLYFAMARGDEDHHAMEMTKWFNTNYHYIVPELSDEMDFRLNELKIISEFKEAKTLGIQPKINLIGPLTFLGLSKRIDGEDVFDLLDKIIPVYKTLIHTISSLDKDVYVQLDEPLFVRDVHPALYNKLHETYSILSSSAENIHMIVATYFEHSSEATKVLVDLPVWAIGLDFIYGKENLNNLPDFNGKKLLAGIVDGRNIWINPLDESVTLLNHLSGSIPREDIIVSSSCSMLHVPFSLKSEIRLDSELKNWLRFAVEKLDEIRLISKQLHDDSLSVYENDLIKQNREAIAYRKISQKIHNENVQTRVQNLKQTERPDTFEKRIKIQKENLNLPDMPTTTIGSFPQTTALRKLRRDLKKGEISNQEYEAGVKSYIDHCIHFQEEAGIDVLVHGEPERNDMVEYFGEQMNGFLFTQNGWVQSYGSRCVKPPVIYGDVNRPQAMTVPWITYAQKKTSKPMKGMLTGPATMIAWSFVRDDIPLKDVARQIAIAISDEINDLQNAGIHIVQMDEAAFREGYPLRNGKIQDYEAWAVQNFKLAVSSAKAETQIHTHMCYSDFNDIIKTIESLDADVISIENARSGNELLNVFKKIGYKQEVGPGVYDIHSPRIPSKDEIKKQIRLMLEILPKGQLWINPDCGLKTRKWEEVDQSLRNMTDAVREIREV